MKKIFLVLCIFILSLSFIFNSALAQEDTAIYELDNVNPYFNLRAVSFVGNTVCSDDELKNLINDKIGTKVSDWDMIVLVSKINYLYASKGYKYVDTSIKETDYEMGTSLIDIKEIKYGEIEIDTDRYSQDSDIQKARVEKLLAKHGIKVGNIVNMIQLQNFQNDADSSKHSGIVTEKALVAMPDNPYTRKLKITIKRN